MSLRRTPNNALYRARFGFEPVCGIPSDSMIYHPQGPVSDDTEEKRQVIESAAITSGSHVAPPLPGGPLPTGAMVFEPQYHGCMAPVFQAMRNHGPTEEVEVGTGAYATVFGASQPDPVPTYTYQSDRGDDLPFLAAGGTTVDFTLVLAKGAATNLTTTSQYLWSSIFEQGAPTHPNPFTSEMWIRGLPHQWGLRRDTTLSDSGLAASIYVRIVDSFTDASGVPWVVMMARAGKTAPITNTWSVTAGQNTFTATGGTGGLAKDELVPRDVSTNRKGDVITVLGEVLEVDQVLDDNSFTTVGNHVAGATNEHVIGEYGYTDGFVFYFAVEARLSPQLDGPVFADMRASTGAPLGERLAGSNQEVMVRAATGIVPGTPVALTNPVTVTVDSKVVSVPGGGVVVKVIQGGLLTTPGDLVGKRVTRIVNDTTFEVDFPYAATETGVVGTFKPPPLVSIGSISTTIATTGLTGTGFLTSLAVGSWVRTAGGQVRRVVQVTDDSNAVVDFPWTLTEAAVAGTTDYEFVFTRPQLPWVFVSHPSGPILEQLGDVRVTTEDGETTVVGTAESLTINQVTATVARRGIGGEHGTANTPGQSSGSFELVLAKVDTTDRVIQGSQRPVQYQVDLPATKQIGTSIYYYSLTFIINVRPTEPVTNTPDGTTNQVTISGTTHANAQAPNGYSDALTIVHVGDDPDPLNLA